MMVRLLPANNKDSTFGVIGDAIAVLGAPLSTDDIVIHFPQGITKPA